VLLTPGKTLVRSIPVGVTYGFDTKQVDLNQTDLPSIARAQLEALRAELKGSSVRITDKISKYHVQDLVNRITKGLDPK